MSNFEAIIEAWEDSLCEKIELGGLYARNPVAHKWKVLHRVTILRELVSWRLIDLLKQALLLERNNHILGSRVLLRSAIETLALLIFSSQKMETIVRTNHGFHEFSVSSSKLLLGSRNSSTEHESINILTILEKCNRKYDGISGMYDDLSESSHPNWEGMSLAYSRIDHEEYITYFENRWKEKFNNHQDPICKFIMYIFESEYNDVWPAAFESFEGWVERNDSNLEATM
jgi:hypothetical protein